jgi:molybdate transport system ATP-binding protein
MKHLEEGRETVLIDIRHVDVTIKEKRILTDISWQLRRGEHWAFLGGNGAGKSTLLKLICGELWPDRGSIGKLIYRFEGVEQETPLGIKRHIGFVSPERQDAYARNGWDLTVEEVIFTGFFDSIWLYESPTGEQYEYAGHIINLLGLTDVRDKRILEMSEGERRKVLVARALISRPRVLILDEFCSGLDVPSRRNILSLIERVALSGVQVIFTAHRVHELVPALSDVLLLKSGRIVYCGKKESVLIPDASGLMGHSVRSRISIPLRNRSPREEGDPDDRNACLVNIKDADVYLNGRKILGNIRWKMLRNENWAILGKNAAGKSTFLKLVLGDVHPAFGGTISRFGGIDGDIMNVKKRIGYLSSELQGNYDWDLSGEDLVHSGFFSSIGLYRTVTDRQRERAKEWMQFFGIECLGEKGIFTMSYGEVRKLLVVRAMVNDPDILVLDEPCSGLDMTSREDLLSALQKLSGTRIILVTHHPEDLIPSITHLLLMDGGRIIAAGRKEDMLRKKKIREIFGDLAELPSSKGKKT